MANLLNARPSYMANYDYADIAAGTGIKRYYGASVSGGNVADPTVATSGLHKYILTDWAIYSDQISVNISGGNYTNWKIAQTRDFEMKMNRPQTIDGDILVQTATGMKAIETGGKYTRLQAGLWISGATALTHIVSGCGMMHYKSMNAQNIDSRMQCIFLPVNKLRVKRGEYIKIRINQYAQDGGPNTIYGFGIDPMGRSDADAYPHIKVINTTEPTYFIVDIPYRLDI